MSDRWGEPPHSEPGWEMCFGAEALAKWGPKDRETMEIFIHSFWEQPDHTGYYCAAWYRRPVEKQPLAEHFI
jgi:aromatic ring-cleaving dioxygenase